MDEEIAKHREEIEKAIQEWLDSVEATGYTAPPADVSAWQGVIGGRTGRHWGQNGARSLTSNPTFLPSPPFLPLRPSSSHLPTR